MSIGQPNVILLARVVRDGLRWLVKFSKISKKTMDMEELINLCKRLHCGPSKRLYAALPQETGRIIVANGR